MSIMLTKKFFGLFTSNFYFIDKNVDWTDNCWGVVVGGFKLLCEENE